MCPAKAGTGLSRQAPKRASKCETQGEKSQSTMTGGQFPPPCRSIKYISGKNSLVQNIPRTKAKVECTYKGGQAAVPTRLQVQVENHQCGTRVDHQDRRSEHSTLASI